METSAKARSSGDEVALIASIFSRANSVEFFHTSLQDILAK